MPECVALAQWLSSPTCSLEKLDIGLNNLTSEHTGLIFAMQNCTLNELSISVSEITNHLLISLFCLPLVKLCLWNCHIGPEGTCKITGALYSDTVLEELHLSDNPIGDRGTTALADILLHNKTLKTIYLQGTSLTAQGTQALLQSLQYNTSLRKLGLSKIESQQRKMKSIKYM